jgi:hypothetical protein
MRHDPLCSHSRQFRWFQRIDDCQCELILKVREDERAILQFDLMADKYHAWEEAFEQGYKMGKESGMD